MSERFQQIAAMPLVAILRGLVPEDAAQIGQTIIDGGLRCIEVPLNSPRPLESIAILAELGGDRLIGAGTVLTPAQVDEVAQAGGRIIVSPNMNAEVIKRTKALGLLSLPGIATPSEAFAAIEAGADGLKLFPAEMHSPATLKAMKAVIPPEIPIFVVGGVSADTLAPWLKAGANGFGIGSSLFRSGIGIDELSERTREFTGAWRAIVPQR